LTVGPGIGGGYGLVFTLASGVKFLLSATGDGMITGISAPLTKGFFNTLATGFVYQLPIAAALLAIHQFNSIDILPSLKEGDSCASQHKFLFHRQLPLD
jgi:hypothetical protein